MDFVIKNEFPTQNFFYKYSIYKYIYYGSIYLSCQYSFITYMLNNFTSLVTISAWIVHPIPPTTDS